MLADVQEVTTVQSDSVTLPTAIKNNSSKSNKDDADVTQTWFTTKNDKMAFQNTGDKKF